MTRARRTGLVGIAVVLFVVAIVFATQRRYSLGSSISQRGPSLRETLAWMDRTYNPHKDGFGGHGSYIAYKLSYHETLTYKGCQITTIAISPREGDHELQEVFNLRDIDPQSIRTVNNPRPGTVAEVEFKARNDAEALTYTGNIIGAGIRSGFEMDDAEYALRFAKAFRHAVELCGGKPSDFPED